MGGTNAEGDEKIEVSIDFVNTRTIFDDFCKQPATSAALETDSLRNAGKRDNEGAPQRSMRNKGHIELP